MASPISAMEAIEIVRKAVVLFQKIRDYPDEIRSVGRRIEDLEFYLAELQALINQKHRHSIANLRPQGAERLRTIIRDIRVDAKDVYEILEIWSSAGRVEKVIFSVGRNPRRLGELTASLDGRKQDLRDILQLMGLFASNANHGVQSQRPSTPTPPEPPRKDFAILFLDPNNVGRSRVAEGYTRLLREWTVKTSGDWRIQYPHSAGFVRSRSDCIDVLQGMKPPIPIGDGNKVPSETAMASLFDNAFFNYPYKAGVKQSVLMGRSRGITQGIFKTYDYILVFVGREYERLISLKKELIQLHGNSIAPAGKGRIIHLGAYLSQGGRPVEIVDPKKHDDGSSNRAEWNATTSKIKLGVRAFLQNELDWRQPASGAAGQS